MRLINVLLICLVGIVWSISVVTGQTVITALGTPIKDSVAEQQFRNYKLSVSSIPADFGAEDSLTFVLSAYSGDADLYISSSGNPVLDANKKCTNCILDGSSPNAEVKLIKKSDSRFPVGTDAAFYIGVYGYTAADFILNTYIPSTQIVVNNGEAQFGYVLRNKHAYFKYDLDDSSNFTIAVSALSGDPDIYVSTTTATPDAQNSEWHSTSFGFDVIPINSGHPSYKAQATYHIGVMGFIDSYFLLSVSKPLTYIDLLEGLGVTSFVEAGQYVYFKHTLKKGGQSLVFTVVPISSRGDPDIFITDDISQGYPSKENCKWCKATTGDDIVTIENAAATTYYIGIYGYGVSARFQLIAHAEYSTTTLPDGLALPGYVAPGQCTYYKYSHGDDEASLIFSVTPSMGSLQLYSAMENTHPDANKHDRVGETVEGSQRLIYYRSPTTTGTYYVGVCGVTASNFTITASTNQTYTYLKDAEVSVWTPVPTGYYRYFVYDSTDIVNQDLSISVFPWNGDVDLFVSTTNPHPSLSNYTWFSDNWKQDTVVIPASDPKTQGNTRFYISVYGASFNGQNAFAILAFLSNSTITLQDGISSPGAVTQDRYRYYSYNVEHAGSITISLELASEVNDEANIYVSRSTQKPNKVDYEYKSTNYGNDILTIDTPREGVYYIAVFGSFASGPQIAYTISARQNYQSLPTNRMNMLEASGANQKTIFRTQVSEYTQAVMFAVTLINGRTKMSIFTNSSKDINTSVPDYTCDTWPGNAIYASKTDPKFQPGEWVTVVETTEDSDYFISASTPDYYTWVREGIPRIGVLPHGAKMLYAHWLPFEPITEDYYLNIRIMSGSMDVFINQNYDWLPGPQNFTFSSHGPNDRLMILDKSKLDSAGNLYVGLYATNEHAAYEISLAKASTPRYLALDQPQSQQTAPGAYSYFRILGSVKHPKRVLVYVESCTTSKAPVAYLSGNPENKNPTEKKYDYSTTPTKNSIYIQTLRTEEKPTEEYYLGVNVVPGSSQTYSVYATMDEDSRPAVKKPFFTGKKVKSQIQLTIAPATAPQRFKDKKLAYVVYMKELTKVSGKREVVNFETVCGIQYYGTEIGKARIAAGDTLEYLVDVDPKKDYVVNVIVHDSLGLATPYAAGYIFKGQFQPRSPIRPSRVSVGGVFILLAFIAVVAYVVIGLGYNYYKGVRGIDLIPHREFWMDVPVLILDGIKFIISCGKVQNDYSTFDDDHVVPTSGFGTTNTSESTRAEESNSTGGYGTL